MKFAVLAALLATAQAADIMEVPLFEAPETEQSILAEISSLEQSLTASQYNPHMITTTFLEEAQKQIDALVGKAARHEHQTNLDHMKDINS